MKKVVFISLLLLSVIVGGVFSFNYFTLVKPYDEMFKSDYRNQGVEASVYYQHYVNPNVLVFDMKNISNTNSMADVFRVFWSYSGTLKHKKFERVELAFRGKAKFYLKGDYFQSLGKSHNVENPIYVINHFSENVYNLNDSKAFATWTGGWLGVAQKQMEDFNNFHRKWYLNELLK